MGPRLPLASSLHPVLGALGRKYPYWLVASVTADIVRPYGDSLHLPSPVSIQEIEEAASVFLLKTKSLLLPQDITPQDLQQCLLQSISEARPGLVWWRHQGDGWWYPLIGHDEGCSHFFIRTWGQRHHEYHTLSLDSAASFCLFEPLSPPPPESVVARKALERSAKGAGGKSGSAASTARPPATLENWAQSLENLPRSDAVRPDVAYAVATSFECALNGKRAALEFCSRASRWLPVETSFLEKARCFFDLFVSLLQPAAVDFGSQEKAEVALKKDEKRIALARTYRAAARLEARAIFELEAAVSHPTSLAAE